ncbi:MAG: right-handed parallel beta-helix repeat-containing protein [Verrucomicrobiales bacterium]
MVGCHEGVIEGCTFEGREGFSQDNGVQMKGGSANIVVRNCLFKNAGQRAINLGGSTGLPYFRPANATWEARDIEVTGCRFTGSLAPVCWVGIDGGHVHGNTIHLPDKWVLRILQENTDSRFVPCRNGRFEKNLIVFDRRVRVFANVGPNTEPGSFTFANNAWFCVDDPSRRPGDLPAPETGSVIGVDPQLGGDLTIHSSDPQLKGIGAR